MKENVVELGYENLYPVCNVQNINIKMISMQNNVYNFNIFLYSLYFML